MDDIKSEASPSPETIAMFINQRRFSMPNMYGGYSMNPMIPVGGMDMPLNMDMGLMDMSLSMDLLMPLTFPNNPMLLELQQQQHQPNPYHCAPAPI
ncbi:hypothetical protein HDU77_001660, partial [Chytriomyces hyalinus]